MTIQHGFELLDDRMIPEINTRARLYRHAATGAELLSLENDDENKVFGITFATPPTDSTGLPHIMEHCVLCGSRKYPVKEPYIELYKGSLHTFLNAMTYSDKTTYPVASQNLQDFYNLVDVYLDAVFYPRITPQIFQQEGWHYELDSPDAPLIFKGVVFNEMKGAYSSPENYLGRQIEQSLYPDTPYGFDSGGDPAVIPNLTYEQFKRFHETYYHPSNARIFFYGDDDPAERLRLMEVYLRDYERRAVPADIPLQPPFAAPRQLTDRYVVSADEDQAPKAMFTVNWALTETVNVEMTLAQVILEHILIGTPASPLRKALIDSGLGEDLAGSGLDLDVRQCYFSTGLKGIAVEDAERVETLIMDTLRDLAANGIEPGMIEAAVNTVEFALRENNTGPYPRGLLLMLRALRSWLHGGDPLAALAFDAPLTALKTRLAAGERLFEQMIATYLLDNPHRSTILLKPDAGLKQEREAAEAERLNRAQAAMSRADLEQVIADTRALKALQETPDSPEALATIPSLQLDDLDRQGKTIPLEVRERDGSPVLFHDLFTNGIVYYDLGFNLQTLPQEYLPYVSLFGRALLEMGTETEDFVKLSQRIGQKTGGIEPSILTASIYGAEQGTAWLLLRGKATTERAGDLLAILRDVLLSARLDNQERFRQLVLEEKAGQEMGLVPSGHAVIRSRLHARLNATGWAAEQMEGISYLFFLRRLADDIENNWPAVLDQLETIRRLLINRRAAISNITVDGANWAALEPKLGGFLDQLPAADPVWQTWTPDYITANEGLVIPALVNYVGKAANLYPLGYQLDGSILPILNYLRTTWLWERVRVHGGAYGAFCTFDDRSGVLAFLSYRDPNLLGTLENYDQTGPFLQALDLSQDELVKSIIGAIGTLDAYQLPDAKGYTSLVRYLTGETDEMRQQRREEVLSTTQANFRAFADVLAEVRRAGLVTVLGSQEAIESANAAQPGLLHPVKVL